MRCRKIQAAPLTDQGLLDSLRDMGCAAETAARFMELERAGCRREQLQLLSGQRRRLLEELHRAERRVDCLDYLVYQLQQREEDGPDILLSKEESP